MMRDTISSKWETSATHGIEPLELTDIWVC